MNEITSLSRREKYLTYILATSITLTVAYKTGEYLEEKIIDEACKFVKQFKQESSEERHPEGHLFLIL